MPASVKIKSGETCVWGAPQSSDLGIIKNFGTDKGAKTSELPGPDGTTTAVAFYDQTTQNTLNVYAKSTATLPNPGDEMTVGSTTLLVMSARQRWESEGFMMIEVVSKLWENLPTQG